MPRLRQVMQRGKGRRDNDAVGIDAEASTDGPAGAIKGRAARRVATKRTCRRRWIRNTLLVTLSLVVLAVGAAVGYAYYLSHDLRRVVVRGLHKQLTVGHEANTQNILMVGSTSRCALAVQSTGFGLCDEGVDGVNSDVIMILHADPAAHNLPYSPFPVTSSCPTPDPPGRTKSTLACTRASPRSWRRSRRTSASRSSTRCPSTSTSSPTSSMP